MPLYEYRCDDCGTFSAIRKMSEFSMPSVCGNCGAACERVISAPHFALLGKEQRVAHERNEKSAHEPGTMRRSGCGCSGGHTCHSGIDKSDTKKDQASQSENQGAVFQMQTKKTARPWMLSH
jgi:putative FmdB family regulatory protein